MIQNLTFIKNIIWLNFNDVLEVMKKKFIIAAMFLAALVGVGSGVGFYTFYYAKGFSYVKNDPEVCANCHIMQSHYDAWIKSSHKKAAVCNDCHTPHNFTGKYAVKGINGFRHSFAFTSGWFHEPIQINDFNRSVAENACRYCHKDIVQMIDRGETKKMKLSCTTCHKTVGHDQ